MRRIVLAAAFALAIGGTASAQNYYNPALENWQRLQDQQERNADRMLEQQRWMQEQQRETYRDLNNQRPFRGW